MRLLLLFGLLSALRAAGDELPSTPAELYPGLFERVQLERVFDDGKTFVDAVPRLPPERIMEEFRDQRDDPGFDLSAFVIERFEPPGTVASGFAPQPGRSVSAHIDALWPELVRKPDEPGQ
jgi:alpha,alpha-trehalase